MRVPVILKEFLKEKKIFGKKNQRRKDNGPRWKKQTKLWQKGRKTFKAKKNKRRKNTQQIICQLCMGRKRSARINEE